MATHSPEGTAQQRSEVTRRKRRRERSSPSSSPAGRWRGSAPPRRGSGSAGPRLRQGLGCTASSRTLADDLPAFPAELWKTPSREGDPGHLSRNRARGVGEKSRGRSAPRLPVAGCTSESSSRPRRMSAPGAFGRLGVIEAAFGPSTRRSPASGGGWRQPWRAVAAGPGGGAVDLAIAATANVIGVALITLNTRDFRIIEEPGQHPRAGPAGVTRRRTGGGEHAFIDMLKIPHK